MKLARLAISLAVFGMLVPLTAAAQDEQEQHVQRGYGLYNEYCARCHGPDAMGGGPDAGETRVPTADLTTIAARRGGVFPDPEVREIIDGRRPRRAHGPSGMPVLGNEFQPNVSGGAPSRVVVNDRIDALIRYLRSVQRELPADEKPADEEPGEAQE
jgi:mono/diheme cytochrome c family protein